MSDSAVLIVQKNAREDLKKRLYKYRVLYLFLLPNVIAYLVFSYIPIYGITLAFQDWIPLKGYDSPWIGFKNFAIFFSSSVSFTIIRNTVVISFYSIFAGFIFTVILALLLNEIGNQKYKKTVQTIVYAPNFISTVVIVGLLNILFGGNGPMNQILTKLHLPTQNILGEKGAFWSYFVWSGVWQSAGYGTILYLATLSNVDMEQHEAAIIDGANRLQRIWYINIPALKPILMINLIMSFSGIMSVGFDKIYLMQNELNISHSEVISTYIYKTAMINGNMSFSAAVGIFNNVINCILLLTVNAIARRVSEYALF